MSPEPCRYEQYDRTCCRLYEGHKDQRILGWETIAEARRAVQSVLDQTPPLKDKLEQGTVPYCEEAERLYPIRQCTECTHGHMHAFGRHRFSDGRVMGHIAVCAECGHYTSRHGW